MHVHVYIYTMSGLGDYLGNTRKRGWECLLWKESMHEYIQ